MKSTTYQPSRFFVPSSLPASQTTSKRAARARKTAMKPTPLTYQDLLEKLNYFVSTKQLNPHTAANRATALRGFLRANHISEDDVVGEEMRSKFPDCMEQFLDVLRDFGRKQRNLTNTRAAMTPLRQMVQEDDTTRALDAEKPTPFIQQLKTLLSGHSIKRVANIGQVPYDMMLGWVSGKVPRPSSSRYVHRVENYFGMKRGELWKLSGVAHPSRLQPDLSEAPAIEYRNRLGKLTKYEYWFVPGTDSPLRQQWHDLMVYKTALVPDLERSVKGQWRMSPLPLGRKTDRTWYRYWATRKWHLPRPVGERSRATWAGSSSPLRMAVLVCQRASCTRWPGLLSRTTSSSIWNGARSEQGVRIRLLCPSSSGG